MPLRVTLQTLVARTLDETRRQTDQLARLQQQASTGKRIQLPSEDPDLAAVLLRAEAQERRYSAELSALRGARSSLEAQASHLQEAAGVLGQARSVALEAANATEDPAALEARATQVDRLLDRLLGLANGRFNGAYLFAGSAAGTAPFAVTATDADGRTTDVSYVGGDAPGTALLGPGLPLDLLVPGRDAFRAFDRRPTVYGGTTGARPGAGRDSATGLGTLQVRHTATTYQPGSGVAPGISSAAQDTALGPLGAHRLEVRDLSGTGASGTVSLDGGPPVAFTSADADLRVTGPDGAVVFVDTTAVTPGFQGTVDLAAAGTLSVDGGATVTSLTYAVNQQVIDSRGGAVTNVDASGIRRAGDASLDYAGALDAFEALIALRDDLRNARGLAPAAQREAISGRVAELDRVRSGVLDAVGERSTNLESLEALEAQLEDLRLTTQTLISERGSADLADVVVRLQGQSNLLQLTLAGFSRMLSQDLLDFLR